MPLEKPFHIPYTGPSMRPTFRAGDLLRVVPVKNDELSRGDVILYRPPGECQKVTHRVVSVSPEGVRTRGDASCRMDGYILGHEDVIGRVDGVYRRGRLKSVPGGGAGRVCAFFSLSVNRIDKKGASVLYYPYNMLAGFNLLSSLPCVRSRIRVAAFRRGGGEELQVMFGNLVVGRLIPGEDRWKFKRPFRLLVDERLLNDEIKTRENKLKAP